MSPTSERTKSVYFRQIDVDYSTLPPPPVQPAPPELFFGHETYVNRVVGLLGRAQQTKVVILGDGGMGKTSAALHILHHGDLAGKYGNRRYFVACDAITSTESLATLTLQVLNISPR